MKIAIYSGTILQPLLLNLIHAVSANGNAVCLFGKVRGRVNYQI